MDPGPSRQLSGVRDLRAGGNRLAFTLYDDLDEMVKLAARHELVNMEYERQPEEVFLTYYERRTEKHDEHGSGAGNRNGAAGDALRARLAHGQDAVAERDHLGGCARALRRGHGCLVHGHRGQRGSSASSWKLTKARGPAADLGDPPTCRSQFFGLAPLALFFPILALANAIAGAEERGTIDVLLGNPLPLAAGRAASSPPPSRCSGSAPSSASSPGARPRSWTLTSLREITDGVLNLWPITVAFGARSPVLVAVPPQGSRHLHPRLPALRHVPHRRHRPRLRRPRRRRPASAFYYGSAIENGIDWTHFGSITLIALRSCSWPRASDRRDALPVIPATLQQVAIVVSIRVSYRQERRAEGWFSEEPLAGGSVTYTVRLDEIGKDDLALAGGKGANLGE